MYLPLGFFSLVVLSLLIPFSHADQIKYSRKPTGPAEAAMRQVSQGDEHREHVPGCGPHSPATPDTITHYLCHLEQET